MIALRTCVGLFVLVVAVSPSAARQFTNTSGKRIDAELRGVEDGKAVLFFKNKEWRVPLATLSQADRDYIEQWQTQRRGGSGVTKFPKPRVAGGAPFGFRSTISSQGIRVSTVNGERRVWVDGKEVFGAEADAAAAKLGGHMRGDDSASESSKENEPAFANDLSDSHRRHIEEMRKRHEEFMARTEASRKAREARMAKARAALAPFGSEPEAFEPSFASSEPDVSRSSAPSRPSPAPRSARTSPAAPTYPTKAARPVYTYSCGSCGHTWDSSRDWGVGDRCPSCRAVCDEFTDENGKVERSASASRRRYRGLAKLVIFGVCALGGFASWLSKKMG